MARRDKTPPRMAVRVSHEATRYSKAQVTAAFEYLVPVLERRVRPRTGTDGDLMVDATRHTRENLRRR
jgi:hypothetical protein